MNPRRRSILRGDAAFGPKNIIWAVEHGHQAAISIHKLSKAFRLPNAPQGNESDHAEDGHQRVELPQRLQPGRSPENDTCRPDEAIRAVKHRSGTRFHRCADRAGSAAMSELRRADSLRRAQMYRVRCLHRRLSRAVPHNHAERRGPELRTRLSAPADQSRAGVYSFRSVAADRAHHGEGRRSLCPLRSLRGTLPDGRWDMQKFELSYPLAGQSRAQLGHMRVNDFAFKLANVNGTGRPARTDYSCRRSSAWAFRYRERICSPPTFRAFQPGMRFASTRTATRRERSNTT